MKQWLNHPVTFPKCWQFLLFCGILAVLNNMISDSWIWGMF